MSGYDHLAPPLSPAEYAECFLCFKRISTEHHDMLAWVRDHLLEHLPVKDPFAILSIGCGIGDFDFQFIRVLKSRLKTLQYVMVEPNETMCRQLRDRISRHALPGVQYEIDPMTFEEFAIGRRFDLIHFTHCLYYLQDREGAILHALDSVPRDGLVLIFHQTPLGLDQIQRKFLQKVKGEVYEMFTSKEMERILNRNGIPYQVEEVNSFVDVSDCFRPDSQTGRNLLRFFLDSDVCRLGPEVQQEILEFLEELTLEEQGRRLLFQPVAIFCLYPRGGRS